MPRVRTARTSSWSRPPPNSDSRRSLQGERRLHPPRRIDDLDAADPLHPPEAPPAGSHQPALVSRLVRATDRVLFAGSSIKLYLADGGTEGTAVFLARLREVAPILADQVRVRSVTLGDGELSSDAFDRLKGSAEVHHP